MVKAKDYISSGFSTEDAEVLNQAIKPLFEKKQKITVDFSEVRNFTAHFFNQTFAQYLVQIGPAQYDEIFEIKNLSNVGKITYGHSLENAKDYSSKSHQKGTKP